MTHCILEANIATSQISYPFQRGWLETPEWLILRDRVSHDQIDGDDVCALVDAVTAMKFLESHSVIADVALVSTHRGPIGMLTNQRPDEVENAVVQLGEVSATAEALARSTIHHFYGIDVVDWNRSTHEADVTVVEGTETMRTSPGTFREDLIRAWFILTSLALPTHVLIGPKAALERDQAGVRRIVELLQSALSLADERKREVRRNLSEDLEVDRNQLTEFLNDQKTRLTKSSRKGWLDLTNRVARVMNLPVGPNPDVVTFGKASED